MAASYVKPEFKYVEHGEETVITATVNLNNISSISQKKKEGNAVNRNIAEASA